MSLRPSRCRTARSGVELCIVVALVLASASALAAQGPAIPWLDQRPAKASAHPPLAPPCTAAQLHAHLFLQGATGSLVGGVNLTNAGTAPCSLLGWPRVSFTGTTQSWNVKLLPRSPVPHDALADPPGSLRALAPGKSASVQLFWSNWCGDVPSLELGLPGGTSVVIPLARTPRCDAPQGEAVLSVTPFAPAIRTLPPSSRLPLAVRILGPRPVFVKPGLHAFSVHRGSLFHYTVALTNSGSRAFRFARSSCPIYIEELNPDAPQPYVLNCRPAGPIAPHGSALFAMQIAIPSRSRLGNTSLTWELAPRTAQAPFAPAAVWVLP